MCINYIIQLRSERLRAAKQINSKISKRKYVYKTIGEQENVA